MSSPTAETSLILALSNNLADATEQAGRAVVAINGRSRHPSSGVCWRSGIIVTAEHALKRDAEISITLPDGQSIHSTLVGRDSSTDLAVLKLSKAELPTAEIADASNLKVGHLAIAVGRSTEGGLLASMGVLSAIGGSWRSWCGGLIDQFLRLDLTLYPGLEGGPAVDATGRVFGINTSGPRRTVLTIPAATVNRVVEQLLQTGQIGRGYLGLGMQSVVLPATLKQALNWSRDGGVMVINVEPNGPADRAGALLGDVLLAFDGVVIANDGTVHFRDRERIFFTYLITLKPTGSSAALRVLRDGAVLDFELPLAPLEALVPVHKYDTLPSYFICAGMVCFVVCGFSVLVLCSR